MITLDTNLDTQVLNPKVIEADLTDGRKMMIFSGTALPQWRINDDDHTYRQTAVVNLRRTAADVEQATVSVGLASVGNDDTLFLFALDSATLSIDPNSQELLLNVDMAAQGEKTSIARFGYQVVTVVTTQATGISGAILWEKDVFDASKINPQQIAQMFRITANHVDHADPSGSQFPIDTYTPVASGVTTAFFLLGNDYVVEYNIPGAPFGQPLVVAVDVGSLFRGNALPRPFATQFEGPNPVVLSIGTSTVTGVDFRVFVPNVR